jgi:hypothetical protein
MTRTTAFCALALLAHAALPLLATPAAPAGVALLALSLPGALALAPTATR